jgi:hypothetical protein
VLRSDTLFALAIAATIAVVVALGVVAVFAKREPWTIVGAPAAARCSRPNSEGIRTCVADGVAYTCVTDWGRHVITCGQRRQP